MTVIFKCDVCGVEEPGTWYGYPKTCDVWGPPLNYKGYWYAADDVMCHDCYSKDQNKKSARE